MAKSNTVTTAQDIYTAIQTTQVKWKSSPNNYEHDMNECYPGLYIGNLGVAKNKAYLKKTGITHILNTAQGTNFACVDTGAEFYKDVGMKYMGMKLVDMPWTNISKYFESGADFIEEALSQGGKILVHCFMGISRSSTIACSYLMLKKKMSAVEAIQTLRQNRDIYPNGGFVNQLADLDNKLRQERSQL